MKRSRAGRGKGQPVGYAKRLQTGHYKGRCGGAEDAISNEKLRTESKRLAQMLRGAPIVVAHTGAGLSTAAGIPDFRGKDGVWTLEEQGQPLPDYEKCWDNAMPTLGHMALVGLVNEGIVTAVISQNVDGLHLRSGIPREKLCELHGNLFMEVCSGCQRELRRTADVGGVGFKPTGRRCPHCSEGLVDVLLDWEDELRDYEQAVALSDRCREPNGVSLCLGTSLQISPSKDLPAKADKMAIVNLQRTPKDARAAVVVRAKIDAAMRCVMEELSIPIPVYRRVETLVISHTSFRPSGKNDRWKWAIVVGDAADGARCGFVESMGVSFPGTKLSEALVADPPFRVSRTTMSRRLTEGRGESRLEEGYEIDSGVRIEAKAGRAEEGVQSGVGVGADFGVEVGVDVGVDVDASPESGVGCGVGEFMTVVLALSFVAPPGHTTPKPLTVEYRMDLAASEGSQEVEVFLGEVDYNDTT
ncbi:unnamed protein product [Pylaiella littoralis]